MQVDVKTTLGTRCERQSSRERQRLHRHHTTPHHTIPGLSLATALRSNITAATSSVSGCTSPPRLPWGAASNANSSSLKDMLEAVWTIFQQIMTELNGAESEEERIVVVTRIVLKLMKQNGCIYMTCTTDYDRDKWQTHPLVREGAPHRQNRNCLTVTQIWFWVPEGARHQDYLANWPSFVTWLLLRLDLLLSVTDVTAWRGSGKLRLSFTQRWFEE
jgi:hypothetical protein